MRIRWFNAILFCGLGLNLFAETGLLETLDGRKLEGQIEFAEDAFRVSFHGSAGVTVPLTNLAAAHFHTAAPGAPSLLEGSGNGILGFYYANTNLDGDPFVRLDQTVDFDWGTAAPAVGLDRDYFSVRWMADVEPPATGDYTFYFSTDDGGRLMVANQLFVERWQRQESTESTGTIAMEGGKRYPLRFEYFDFIGNARAKLMWSGPGFSKSVIPKTRLFAASSVPGHRAEIQEQQGLLATYYSQPDFGGQTFTRVDSAVDFRWAATPPAPGIPAHRFSVRWSGQLLAGNSQIYTFYAVGDEGVRLWINDALIINAWNERTLSQFTGSLGLQALQKYDLRLETRNTDNVAEAKLFWSGPSLSKCIIPQTNLFPSRPSPAGTVSLARAEQAPQGVLLRDGSFLAGPVLSANRSALRMGGVVTNHSVSLINVARIDFRALPKETIRNIPAGRSGALLPNGDFVEGELRGIEDGRLQMSSILFGPRSFQAGLEAAAFVLQEARPVPARYQVRTRDGSDLHVDRIEIEPKGIALQDAALGKLRLPADALDELTRVAPK